MILFCFFFLMVSVFVVFVCSVCFVFVCQSFNPFLNVISRIGILFVLELFLPHSYLHILYLYYENLPASKVLQFDVTCFLSILSFFLKRRSAMFASIDIDFTIWSVPFHSFTQQITSRTYVAKIWTHMKSTILWFFPFYFLSIPPYTICFSFCKWRIL